MRTLNWLMAFVLGMTVVAHGDVVYVSPSGDDANPGTKEKPIRTIEHAKDLVRALNQKMSGDVVVYLDGGTYRLSKPLVFEADDSGTNGHDVTYQAVPGQQVIISGGIPVTGWKLIDPARNLWSAPAPDGLKNSRQLYVDGVRAHRAGGLLPVKLTETSAGYIADSDLLSHWKNPSDIEFIYTGGNAIWGVPSVGLGAWTEPRCPVASISGQTITMAQPCWDNSTKRVRLPENVYKRFPRDANLVGPGSVGKEPAYIENAFELLTEPGQWYFDRPAGTIYYIPRKGEDLATADVEVPVLEQLIVGHGTPDAPVHNLRFEGIQFSYATWLYPSSGEGFSEIQANYMVTGPDGYSRQGLGDNVPDGKQPFGDWTKTPGNVAFQYDHNIQFIRDAFVHLGAAGLDLGDGSQNDNVEGSVFTDISGNGFELGGVDLPEASDIQATRDNRIANNHLYDIPVEFHGGIGIDIGYTQRTQVDHNQLNHLAYAGISLGWGGWMDKIDRPGVANNSQNVVVSNNLIFNHMLVLADGGGIYTQGLTGPDLANGEKVTGNVIRDQFSTGHAIYSDNGSANMTITGNVMFHTNFDNWGTAHANYYNGGDGSTKDPFYIADNYWQQGDPDKDANNVTEKNNHLIATLDEVPASIINNAGLQSDYRDILDERFSKDAAPESPRRAGAIGGDGFAYVTWNPPVYEGSSPIKSYTVTSSSGQFATISAEQFFADGFAKVTGLPNGTPCRFTVVATNDAGSSSPAMSYGVVTPGSSDVSPPSAPVIKLLNVADGRASVHFQAPADNGGAPILAYQFVVNPGGQKYVATGRAAVTLDARHVMFYVIDGLQPGTHYTISLSAINVAGVGEAATQEANPG